MQTFEREPNHPGRPTQRAVRDLVVASVVAVCGTVLFVSTDTIERIWPAVARWEFAELDDVLLGLVLTVIMAGWFSFRRFRESQAQVVELERNALERAAYMKRLEALSSQVLEVEERERNRISDVLHDEIGQTLYACQLRLELLATRRHHDAARALIEQARDLTSAAMTRARDLSVQLSPPALHDLGIAEALESLLARLQDRYGLPMRFDPGPAWAEIQRPFYGPVFQSVAELATNAAKHGNASCISLSATLDPEGMVSVVVADDGRGFAPHAADTRGFGLFSVERRLACIAASLEIQSSPERGTSATLRLPLSS